MSVKGYLQAMRAFSFTATAVSVALGAVLAFQDAGSFSIPLFLIVLVCAILMHAGTNVLSDYFDYKKGIDTDYSFGSSRVITEKLLTPRQVLIEAIVIFSIAVLLSLILIYFRGWPILVLGLLGLLAAIFYGFGPGYKYFALGDLAVFLMFGPLMVFGSYYVLAERFSIKPILLSLPVAFLVALILVGNNIRDIKHDIKAGSRTIANLLGHSKAKWEYYLLIAAAFVTVFIMTFTPLLTFWSLAVLVTIPIAFKNIVILSHSVPDNPQSIADLDVKSAQLHLVFGILLIASIVIGMAL
ncbi:MAG: 1,4-dihydroxy-2-naphthoate octaprenyltransferase [Phycisphaerae bacterium]|nr:1,4-dihydroxy-2-naphthoate octaprenyltransferase [Phycisphaerae bacterium]